MRAHIFQHLPFEKPGSITPWLSEAGYDISFTFFYENPGIPSINEIDFLVIMGGSMSVNDEDKFPWLIEEKQFIREFITAGKPVLGICLGSQMIASALGARVYPNKEKEIGWFPIQIVKSANPQIFQFPNAFTLLHWHGETFDLPEGAILLASSDACQNQAFQVGKNVLAIQFHPEATIETMQDFVYHFKKELVPGRFIQTEQEILSVESGKLTEMQQLVGKIMEFLTA